MNIVKWNLIKKSNMNKSKITRQKVEFMKELYKRYKSCSTIGRIMKINRATVSYWLGFASAKPKFKYLKNEPETKNWKTIYTNFILYDDYETEEPKALGKQLRDDFIKTYGKKPEIFKWYQT